MQFTRHGFALQWLILLAVLNLMVCAVPASFPAGTASVPAQGPASPLITVVSGTTHNATVIRVMTGRACTPAVHYANASWFAGYGTYDHEGTGIPSGSGYLFSLTGLEPGTRYTYRVTGCGEEEMPRSFATFPVSGTCRFVVYGDTREQAPLYTQTDRHTLVADRIAEEEDIRFVVNAGDLVSDSNDRAEWARFFNATEKLRSRTTYIAVPGNHDQDRALFGDLFGMTGPSSLDCGNARVLLLDSTDDAPENLTEQAARVASAFGSFGGAKIVILHHPPYSSDEKHYGGWENLRHELVPVFQETGVRLVFSGHVHAFEQVGQHGITYITEARGGAPAYPLHTPRIPGSVRAFENTLGYSRVTVDPGTGKIIVDIIRVADVSPDLRSVTRTYPAGTADARIVIPFRNLYLNVPAVSDLTGLPMLRNMQDIPVQDILLPIS
jgi:predicted phosphodiesterase